MTDQDQIETLQSTNTVHITELHATRAQRASQKAARPQAITRHSIFLKAAPTL
jgi:hypothetical protein